MEVSEGSWVILGVLLGSWGVRETSGRDGEIPGESRGIPGGAVGLLHFPLLRSAFTNGPTEYWWFSAWGRFVKRSIVFGLFYFLLSFEAFTFAKQ